MGNQAGAFFLVGISEEGYGHEDVCRDAPQSLGLHHLVAHDDVAFVGVDAFAAECFIPCCGQG